MDRKLPFEIHRELLVRAEDETSPKFGKPPGQRTIAEHIRKGAINLDKPAGPTSHEVTAWVKKILGLDKAGHSGTLDPNVTGLLPTMLGDATKVVDALLDAGKEYVCLMRLHGKVPEKKIQEICREFTGPIYQKPSVKSAVKRETRIRNIYYLDVLEIEDGDVLYVVGCEAGTYIRKLCHDMGEALGTGAHMQELRRTKAGPFKEDEHMVTLHDLMDAHVAWKDTGDEAPLRRVILPMEAGLAHLPRVVIRDTAVDAICHGAELAVPGILKIDSSINRDDLVAVFTLKGEAVSFGSAKMSSEEMMEADSGAAVGTDRVLLPAGTYPRIWKTG